MISWFRRELPRCVALVPARRHLEFLEGIYHYAVEEGNDLASY